MTDDELNQRFDGVAELIRNVAERLDSMAKGIEQRFDPQAARLDRHAALWQTGSRWAAKHHE